MKSIDKPNVYIRDSVRVREKLKILYEGGPDKLQVCVSGNIIYQVKEPIYSQDCQKSNIQEKSRNNIVKQNDTMLIILKWFYLNGHIIGFHKQTQKLELNYM